MSGPDSAGIEPVSELGRLLGPVVLQNQRKLETAVTSAVNAWGTTRSVRPLIWQLKPRDPWEPHRGQRLVGLATAGDYAEEEITEVLERWAQELRLEPRGDQFGDGSLTFMSPENSRFQVEIWGVIDRDAWEEYDR